MPDHKTILFIVIITLLTALAAALLYSLDMLPQFLSAVPPAIIYALSALWCPLWGIRQYGRSIAGAKAAVGSALILFSISLTILALDPMPGELWSVFWIFLFFESFLLSLTFTTVFLFALWETVENA